MQHLKLKSYLCTTKRRKQLVSEEFHEKQLSPRCLNTLKEHLQEHQTLK